MQNGKGDRTRRSSVSKNKFDKNWEKTFSKKPAKPEKDEANEQSNSTSKD